MKNKRTEGVDTFENSCLDCVRKHLSTAWAYLLESRAAYPKRIFNCIGELVLAEHESSLKYPGIAEDIRNARIEILNFANNSDNSWIDEDEKVHYDLFYKESGISDLIDKVTIEAHKYKYSNKKYKRVCYHCMTIWESIEYRCPLCGEDSSVSV